MKDKSRFLINFLIKKKNQHMSYRNENVIKLIEEHYENTIKQIKLNHIGNVTLILSVNISAIVIGIIAMCIFYP